MKVYVLFSRIESIPFSFDEMVSIYSKERDALAAAAQANADNPNPVISDDYGPVSGCYYYIETVEVK